MTDRIRTVDMSDPAVVLDCYLKLNVAYKELKAENAKLRAALINLWAAAYDLPRTKECRLYNALRDADEVLKEA